MEENNNVPSDKEEKNKSTPEVHENKVESQAEKNQSREKEIPEEQENLRSLLAKMSDEDLVSLVEKAQTSNFYLDALQRLKAEYENFQKRSDKERSAYLKYASQPLLSKLMSVLDIFETAIQAGAQIQGNSAEQKFFEGIDIAHKEFLKVLQEFGMNKIQSVGGKFNPAYHEAIQQKESAEHPEMTVVEEVQTGYLFYDRLLRASKVIVSRKPKTETPT